ncbi:MAG TPA: hypothetical protein VF528_08140 [Pyrinomonadaceae bacterium]
MAAKSTRHAGLRELKRLLVELGLDKNKHVKTLEVTLSGVVEWILWSLLLALQAGRLTIARLCGRAKTF